MAHDDQLDIRELKSGQWRLEFPYNAEFIEFLKLRVPARERQYDPDTKRWLLLSGEHLAGVERLGMQHFQHVTKTFFRDGKEVWKNLKTGIETIQENLFS